MNVMYAWTVPCPSKLTGEISADGQQLFAFDQACRIRRV
jgi:hypothetical protein